MAFGKFKFTKPRADIAADLREVSEAIDENRIQLAETLFRTLLATQNEGEQFFINTSIRRFGKLRFDLVVNGMVLANVEVDTNNPESITGGFIAMLDRAVTIALQENRERD